MMGCNCGGRQPVVSQARQARQDQARRMHRPAPEPAASPQPPAPPAADPAAPAAA